MLLAKGAEAELRRNGDEIIKERIKKPYRISMLDEKLRKRRTAMEARLLRAARRAGVLTPQVLNEEKTTLKLEFIDGSKVKDFLNEKNLKEICQKIGEAVALLHSYDIIHGDLTTSNMIIAKAEGNGGSKAGKGNLEAMKNPAKSVSDSSFSLWFIDFGLGFTSKRVEDKAIDLYVLHEILESTHFEILEVAWKTVLDAYKKRYADSDKVIKALSDVEKRGRYKLRNTKGEK